MKVKKISQWSSVILVAVFVFTLSAGSLPAEAAGKVYRMKIQSAYPRGDLSMELLKDFAAKADKLSKGRIKIQVFADPELVPAEQLFEATKKGTLTMLHAVAAMWGGIVPVGEVEFGLPYAYNLPGEPDIFTAGKLIRDLFFNTGYADLLRKEYAKQGLYWLDVHSYGPIFTMATQKIRTCDDMKGLKFRVEGSWADYYNALGARGTHISGMEAYMGLKLGTIDASQWDVSAITGLNWHEVAPYWLMGGQNDVVVGHILFNMKSWNELPDDLKKVMHAAAEDYFHKLLKVYVGELKKVDDLIKAGKVIKSPINAACDRKHEEAALSLWDQIGQRDPAAAKAIDIIKNWRKTLR
ncbi:MAG: TRAP transporter substrate-binding protein DctP [Deltaproteobacteria bacterium]|nr:MAG: TRAP transporter substrate-binding protein DctP [Deltaproteobacteria bacterium]